MVYSSDFYTTRSYATRPVVSSYSISTPRTYLATERPGQHQSRNEYSYAKSTTQESRTNSSDPYSRPQTSSYSSNVERTSRSGPGGYNYSTERSSTTGGGPGGYSYSSTTSGRLPGGTSYRHYSYRYPSSYSSYRFPALTRVYSTAYPIYSYHSDPYVAHKRIVTGTRILTPSVRVVTSPYRSYTHITPYRSYTSRVSISPVRIFSSPIRSITPLRITTSPIRDYYRDYRSLSPERVITSPYTYRYRTPHAVLAREYDRIAYKSRPRIGYLPLENYLNSESFINFDTETRKIRSTAEILLREIHAPVPRRYRSATPFVTYREPPMSSYALDSYIARTTNPFRNIANEVRAMSCYPEPTHKYSGKSHLASVRIVGDKGYTIRNPLFSADKVRDDIHLLSYYLKNRRAASEKLNRDDVKISSEITLDPFRPSRRFSLPRDPEESTVEKHAIRSDHLQKLVEDKDNTSVADEIIIKNIIRETKSKKDHRLEDKLIRTADNNAEEVNTQSEEKARMELEKRMEVEKILEMEQKVKEKQLADAARLLEEENLREQNRLAEKEKQLAEEARLLEEENLREQNRLAEKEKQLAEEARLLEEENLREQNRLAEKEKQLAEEARLLEEENLREQNRLAEEARLLEVERLEEEMRLEEEKRLSEQEMLAKTEEKEELEEEEPENDNVPVEKDVEIKESVNNDGDESHLLQSPTEESQSPTTLNRTGGVDTEEEVENKQQLLEEVNREAILAEEIRLEQENELREEELKRLIILKKSAEEDQEAEIVRQAAELEQLARLEQEVANKELQAIHDNNIFDTQNDSVGSLLKINDDCINFDEDDI